MREEREMTARTPSEQSKRWHAPEAEPNKKNGISPGYAHLGGAASQQVWLPSATAAVALTGVLLLSRCAATELRGVLRPQLHPVQ